MNRGDPLRVRDYLEHIAEAIANIQGYRRTIDLGGRGRRAESRSAPTRPPVRAAGHD
jgi:hypothetical protein